MAILTKTSAEGAHWYTQDGKPCHEQPTKSGDGTRKTTILDAKRLHLLPSVTSILSVLAKPGLDTWKLKQVAKACLANPKQPGESDDYYIARVLEASKQEAVDAADLGSQIHNALDYALAGTAPSAEMAPYVQPVMEFLAGKALAITRREEVLVNLEQGYAGRVDALFTFGANGVGVLDWKTRKTEPGKPVLPYDGQGMQLAAYAVAAYGVEALPRVVAANVYISTTEPGRVEVHKHTDLGDLYGDFLAAARLWRAVKQYDPRQAAREVAA